MIIFSDVVIKIVIIIIRVLFFLGEASKNFQCCVTSKQYNTKSNSVIRLILMRSERWNAFEDNYDTIYGFK